MSLTTRASALHPNRRNAAKWVLAIRYLRSKHLWVLEGGKATWRSQL
jgi:hypothetical protein